MADLSKIKLNGIIYNIKDTVARSFLANIPIAEQDEAVENMLDSFDLDYSTTPTTTPNIWQGGSY